MNTKCIAQCRYLLIENAIYKGFSPFISGLLYHTKLNYWMNTCINIVVVLQTGILYLTPLSIVTGGCWFIHRQEVVDIPQEVELQCTLFTV